MNQNSGKCIDVSSSSTANGANIIQYTCDSGQNQQFRWEAIGSYFRIVGRHSGKCLDVYGRARGTVRTSSSGPAPAVTTSSGRTQV